MATMVIRKRTMNPISVLLQSSKTSWRYRSTSRSLHQRSFLTSPKPHDRVPDFAFAFDIDGVLLRSSKPIPGAHKTLTYLQRHQIPFILLTNGGGTTESERVAQLSQKLDVSLSTEMFIQSHTPFAELVNDKNDTPGFKDKCILVVGGEGDNCRRVAEEYGFTNVVTPIDIITAHPTLWPFSHPPSLPEHVRPLPDPLQISAIFVYTDPHDWALPTQLILDLLLSHAGNLGTLSSFNNDANLPNRGYQQDGQPLLYFSNPDLWWAAGYHLPRLGQGGFREALEGVWSAVTGGETRGVKLEKKMCGKPYEATFGFAERKLEKHRKVLLDFKETESKAQRLKHVYMVGDEPKLNGVPDNPESDIRGANQYKSPQGSEWQSVLVRSGVYSGGEPSWKPKIIVDNVWDAVQWGLKSSGWKPSD
ncbi:hypothetical protein MMC12_005526 [Toensbergia leucococca]|nr:hypothetical protein [Toensbergia leucococca]